MKTNVQAPPSRVAALAIAFALAAAGAVFAFAQSDDPTPQVSHGELIVEGTIEGRRIIDVRDHPALELSEDGGVRSAQLEAIRRGGAMMIELEVHVTRWIEGSGPSVIHAGRSIEVPGKSRSVVEPVLSEEELDRLKVGARTVLIVERSRWFDGPYYSFGLSGEGPDAAQLVTGANRTTSEGTSPLGG